MSKPTSDENLFIFGNQNNTTTTSVWKFGQTVPNPFVKTNSLNFNQSNANAKQIFTPRNSRMNVVPSVNVGDDAKKGEINKKYFSRINNFFKESKYCDIDIVIGSKTFNCHRMVLASASSYFDKMFSGAFVESKQKTITLDAVGADCFENILEFVYSKQLRISEKNAYELLTASRYFDIEDMEDFCVKFMISNIPKGQIFEVCSFAHLTDKKELYEAALKYIAENFITLSKREEFSMMSFEILQDVVKHKSLERLDDLMLDLIIRWKNSKSGSIDQARSLLKNVNTGGVTSDFLAKVVMNDDKMSCFSIRTVGIEDLKYMVDEYTYRDIDRTWIQNSNYHKEKCFEKNIIIQERIFTLSCSNSIVPVNEFHMLNLNEEKQPLKVPPISVSRYTLSAINNTIYLHMTDIIPQNIVEVSSLPKAKDMENSKSMFAYVYDLDEWFVIPKPKLEVINSCITTLNNLLYLVGGSHLMDVSVNGYAQCYDPRMPTWIPLPSMSYSHCSGAACPFNGKLYVLGGTKCKCLEVFDPVAGRWEELKAPFYDHSLFSFVSYKNCLWALGNGRNYDKNCREILPECYHTNENIWTKETELKAQNPLAGVVDAIVM